MLGIAADMPGLAVRPPVAPGLSLELTLNACAVNGRRYAGLAETPGFGFSRVGHGRGQNADGSWTTFASDTPRRTDKGLLIEEARTNLFLNSATPATQTIVLATGTWALTVWGSSGGVSVAAATAAGSGFGAVTASPGGATRLLTISLAGTVIVTVTGVPDFVQLEAGGFATSPIPTGGAQATRGADVAVLTGLGSLLAEPYGLTVEVEISAIDGANRRFITVSSGVEAVRLSLARAASNGAGLYPAGGVGGASSFVAGKTGARVISIAGRVRPGSLRAAVDGVLATEYAQTPPVGLNQIIFGAGVDGLNVGHCVLRRVGIRPGDLTDAELQAATT